MFRNLSQLAFTLRLRKFEKHQLFLIYFHANNVLPELLSGTWPGIMTLGQPRKVGGAGIWETRRGRGTGDGWVWLWANLMKEL